MSFDQNMIIDATTGSIARFVNHSCEPNCRMIKWIVSGQPRMALFAGDRPIMTGEELTYDYKFDPFSAKNVQKCLCGSAKCRGVLGPKPKEPKQPKESKEASKKSAQKGANAGKRKASDITGDKDDEDETPAKKRKTNSTAKSVPAKKITTSYGAIKAKTAAAALKRSVSRISASAKSALGVNAAKSPNATKSPNGKAKSPNSKAPAAKKTAVVKTYKKTKVQAKVQAKLGATTVAGSRKSSLTIVAAGSENAKSGKAGSDSAEDGNAPVTPRGKAGRPRKSAPAAESPGKGDEIVQSATKIKLVRSPTSSRVSAA